MKKWGVEWVLAGLLVSGLFLVCACESDDDDVAATNTVTTVTNTVVTVELVAPGMLSPADGTSFNNFPRTITLVWSPVTGADKYVLEVQYSDGTWHALTTQELTATTYTFNFIGMQPGRWRVRAKTNSGTEGAWSNYRGFVFTV